ncbi:MAG: hypothetical protein IBX36_05285 [Dehalococcoidia bacterium]|nr:hypothetical protein [Dehalococcoidia bacterium]
MLKYVGRCKKDYEEGRISKDEFLECVIRGAIKAAMRQPKKAMVVACATKAIIEQSERSRKQGHDRHISGKAIFCQTKFEHYDNTSSHGLWPWLKKNNNADVIEKDSRGYLIKEEFYEAMVKKVYPIAKRACCKHSRLGR